MRLKRLELFGFKSFADRTSLDFPRDLVGIVGPNGCGKSNVVDAVRWVLGETRPTSMRGAEMTDVIFKGSSSRAAMSVAEVTLVLDNDGGEIPAHGAEVSVTRRVLKSGEGEYEIDGSRVRLKDVKDLLFDTGLGSRGYSVLEQGKIDAVLSANPQERRSIFEEAAGISRFRQRRKEAESRLRRVDQDLDRIDDVIRELESRSRSLKIQAGKAERWVTARDEWREKGVRLGTEQLHRFESELARCRTALDELEANVAALSESREQGERELAERTLAEQELSAAVEELAQQAAGVGGDLRAVEERRHQIERRVEAWRASAADETQRVEDLKVRLTERRGELDGLEQEVLMATASLTNAEGAVESESGLMRDALSRYRAARKESEGQSQIVHECLHEKTASFNSVKHVEASLEPLDARVSGAEEKLRHVDEREREAAAEAEGARDAVQTTAEAAARADERRESLLERSEALTREIQSRFTRRGELEVKRAGLESRVEALLDWERERESLDEGARALLDERESLGFALSGLLADHLRVEPRYARALDTALGSNARAVVLEDRSQARRITDFLAERQAGQARLIVTQPFNHGRSDVAVPELPFEFADAVIGPLCDVVDLRADLDEAVRVLLSDCLLVRDLDAALALAEQLPGWRLVTPEGQLVEASGLISGQAEVAAGAIGRRAEAAELSEHVSSLNADIEALNAELERLDTDERQVRETLREATRAVEEARAEASRAEARVLSSQARLEDARANCSEVRTGVEHARAERERVALQLEELRTRSAEATARFETENAKLQALEEARATREVERDELAKNEQRARIEWTRLSEVASALTRRRRDLSVVCAEAEAEIERTESLSKRHRDDAESGTSERAELEAEAERLKAERERLNAELETQRGSEREAREAIAELRQRADAATREVEQHMESASRLRLDQQRFELSLDELMRRAEEDFQFDRDDLVRLYEPDEMLAEDGALEALEAEVTGLKRQLDRLGPVNLEAVEELGEVSTRLAFLTEQRSDLSSAKNELVETIETINSESERLFLEAFEEIRGHFRAVFRQLFGGGRADIVLDPELSVLEAGIEISARPPGRETLPIGLLSGGQRTMTALALLFAVFQSRPSPFCVLDEVDAALDDANVGRFLAMLEGFVGGTQFIVVTHNKGTMAACDMLYGVTMQTKGVSRNVSVELDEVDDFVPEVTGDAAKAAEAKAEAAEQAPEDEPLVELIPHANLEAEAEELAEA